MKGIILAGGNGTRLHPMTVSTSKQLLPIYDKPMIYYPLSVLMLAGIKQVLVIVTPRDVSAFEKLLGDGSKFGIEISYAQQSQANGLAEAFIIGRSFVGNDAVALVLGDNLFYGNGLTKRLATAARQPHGAAIFAYRVVDPSRYGVVNFDPSTDKALEIVEKPSSPKSNWAVTGLYFYDNDVLDIATSISPSERGELEITDINQVYLARGDLEVLKLGRGFAWLDTGTPDSLHEASTFVRTIEHRQGIKIMCPEEIGFNLGYLSAEQLIGAADHMGQTDYAIYLRRVAEAGIND